MCSYVQTVSPGAVLWRRLARTTARVSAVTHKGVGEHFFEWDTGRIVVWAEGSKLLHDFMGDGGEGGGRQAACGVTDVARL
jgi:hypothetical protein